MSLNVTMGLLAMFSLSAFALPVPDGAILSTRCGPNTAPAAQRNRIITRVCLAVVQGTKISLVAVESETFRREPFPTEYLPILAREPALVQPPGQTAEVLLLGTNLSELAGQFRLYVSRKATLVYSRGAAGPAASLIVPKSIRGTDLKGVSFSVEELAEVPRPPVP